MQLELQFEYAWQKLKINISIQLLFISNLLTLFLGCKHATVGVKTILNNDDIYKLQ